MTRTIATAAGLLATALFLSLSPAIGQDSAPKKAPGKPSLADFDAAFRDVAAEVSPAVIGIVAKQEFVSETTVTRKVLLTGTIWDDAGHIVTLGRSLSTATRIELVRGDEAPVLARLLGVDPATDVAVLQAELKGVTALKRGDPAALRRGSLIVTVGNPYGLEGSVRFSNVAGTDRTMNHGTVRFTNAIQLASPVNPGDPGGLVANARGEFVGLMVSSLRPSAAAIDKELGGYLARRLRGLMGRKDKPEEDPEAGSRHSALFGGAQGIGFAIPVTTVEEAVDRVLSAAKKPRVWLGVQVMPVPEQARKALALGEGVGVVVTGVVVGSPAQKGGLKIRDVVLSWNGEAVGDIYQLRKLVVATQPGATIKLEVLRGKAKQSLEFPIGTR